MSYYNYNQPEEEKSASFNDALNHVSRIDICLRQIHQSKINPFQIDPNHGVPNYQVRVCSLSSLWQEIKPYCNADERKIIEKIFMILRLYANDIVIDNGEQSIIVQESFAMFEQFADILEGRLRDLQFSKGLSNPLKEREFVI